ncbi:MAG TPA: ABC transporter permease [Clostridia bacterium]|nr:ABC transporter permease [Clostridia bacterium]
MNTLYYFIKIAQKNKIMIIVYIAILIAFTMMTAGSYEDKYSKTALNIGIVKNEDSQFGNSLIEYLDKENHIYYYDSLEAAELDFYTRFIDGIVEIPKDSEKTLLETNNPALRVSTDVTNSQSIFLQRTVNKYPLYYKAMVNTGQLDLQKLYATLDEKAEVIFSANKPVIEKNFHGFTNVYGFVIMMLLIKLLGDLSISFNKKNIQIRNRISPKSGLRLKGELSLAQIFIAVLVFVFVTGFVLLMFYPGMLKSESLVYYLLILFLWTMVVALFANLINHISKTKNLTAMIGNTVPLVIMFLSGSSLPIEFMPSFMQKVARFSPLFYYNTGIMKITEGNYNISRELLIILAFGTAFFVASLFLSKERKSKTL